MNNGKTRIYDLSKELNLENKDILNLCDQLEIAVKSHSSTITETQVEQIRSAAQSYQKELSNTPTQTSRPRTHNRLGKKEPRKPQIQKLLKHPRMSDTDTTDMDGETSTATLSPPPQRPVKANQVQMNNSPLQNPQKQPDTETQTAANQTPKAVQPLKPPQSLTPTVQDNGGNPDESANKPELKAPPPRPQPSAEPSTPSAKVKKPKGKGKEQKGDKKTGQKAKNAAQPTLKKPQKPTSVSEVKNKPQDKQELQPKPPEPKKTEVATEDGQKTQEPKKAKGRKKDSKKGGSKTPPVAKPKLLQKPSPPRKPQVVEVVKPELANDDVDSPETEEDTEPTLLAPPERPQKLKKPSRKRKEWEEEEDEETLGKAGKGKSAKSGKKRKALILDDEDDDFGLDSGSDSAAATAVSLSVARPPKPKSQSASNNKPAASNRPKKAPPQRDRTPAETSRPPRERPVAEKPPEQVTLTGNLNIRELSDLINVPETDIIKQLFFKGIAVNITQTLDLDTAKMVVEELGIEVETPEAKSAATKSEMLDVADLENLQNRPPVVTIMGHVDHGKTTLLDSIRQTKVAQGEAGGITQHIGAYHVDVEHNGKMQQVVFLDTPGHEAFTAMRARGTKVTDIAILVVAADDGVQPQTREAISHAKAAEVPLIVAINKVDKPEAEPERIKQELTELGLVPEEWGGETIMVHVSAIKGDNLDGLLEMILLVAELEELSANPNRPAKGTVIEANLDKSRGPVATLLVQNGTLRVGDSIVAGASLGRIRAMIDDRGHRVEEATPSFAVEILGLNDVPSAGDEFAVFPTEKEARAVADIRASEKRESRLQQAMSSRRVSLSSLSAQAQEGELKELNLIVKADVQGSVEAILGSLNQLPQNEVQIRVLLAAPGEITETDVDLAAASGAVIIGFNTNLAPGSAYAADREGVDIREYDIIYNLLEEIRGAMEGLLDPEEVEEPLGEVEVRAVFPVGRGAVAGCYVLSGKVVRNRRIRVVRNGEVIHDGILDSLKRMKEVVKEVNAGYECGIGADRFNDWKEGDRIEAYQMVMKRRTLSPA